jgi:hypothetical protein
VGADDTIECPAEPSFSDPTASDDCSIPTLTFEDVTTSGSCPQEYSVTRTWTATDECGNSVQASQTINVVDTTPPVISCPVDVVFNCDDVGVIGEATATDACDESPVIGYEDDTLTFSCPIEIERTWTATDACGNSSSCTQSITIQDVTPPTITGVGPDDTIECPATPQFSEPTAEDACGTPTLTFEDVTTPGSCPQEYSVTRTWTATDLCGNKAMASQTINVVDTTAPVISGVGGDATLECPSTPQFSEPTAEDACGPVTFGFVDVRTDGSCPQEYSVKRTWTATDECGNMAQASQTITVVDTKPPVISGVGADDTIECPAEPSFSEPTASDSCGSVTFGFADKTTPGNCPQEYSVTRTWTATDECGNTASASQTIHVVDTTAPVIACAPNGVIACEEDPIFTPPIVSDNCDSDPVIIMIGTDSTSGPGFGETTFTRSWYAVDACGNASDTCSQEILRERCPEACTFTIGGWGTECPDPQMYDGASLQPGCIRDYYFSFVFPGGSVSIGDASGYTATWYSSAAIAEFLPDGSTPGVLYDDYDNPTTTSAGVLASQILALRLNREYSCAGVFTLVGLSPADYCYGDFVIGGDCGKFSGLTVDEFLGVADMAVSGNTGVLDPYSASLGDLTFTASCLNEQFSGCDPFAIFLDGGAVAGLLSGDWENAEAQSTAGEQLPVEYGLSQNYPNPFNPASVIEFALPAGGHVRLEVFNVLGQRVETLVDGEMPAGYHSVTWDASSNSSGVYFYKITASDFVATKKMLLLK